MPWEAGRQEDPQRHLNLQAHLPPTPHVHRGHRNAHWKLLPDTQRTQIYTIHRAAQHGGLAQWGPTEDAVLAGTEGGVAQPGADTDGASPGPRQAEEVAPAAQRGPDREMVAHSPHGAGDRAPVCSGDWSRGRRRGPQSHAFHGSLFLFRERGPALPSAQTAFREEPR